MGAVCCFFVLANGCISREIAGAEIACALDNGEGESMDCCGEAMASPMPGISCCCCCSCWSFASPFSLFSLPPSVRYILPTPKINQSLLNVRNRFSTRCITSKLGLFRPFTILLIVPAWIPTSAANCLADMLLSAINFNNLSRSFIFLCLYLCEFRVQRYENFLIFANVFSK